MIEEKKTGWFREFQYNLQELTVPLKSNDGSLPQVKAVTYQAPLSGELVVEV